MATIEQLSLYRKSGAYTQNLLRRDGYPIKISKGTYLFHVRDQVSRIYMVLEGYVVLERESDEHGVRSIFLLGPGEWINEVILDDAPASIACRAISDTIVISFSRASILDMMEHDFLFARCITDSMALKIRRLYHMLESSTKNTRLDHQTASRIWKWARDFGISKEGCTVLPFELRITLLAGFVGSNRETISRIVKRLTKEHILAIEKGTCTIYDMEALKHFGKES